MLGEMLEGLEAYKWNLGNGTEYSFATFPDSDETMRCGEISDRLFYVITNSGNIEDFCNESDWVIDCSEGTLIDNLLVMTDNEVEVIFREYALNCWSSVYQMIIGDRASIEDYWYQVFVPDEEECSIT